MTPLSAVDAISPAWRHTSRLLLGKRDWRTLLKLGAVAVFAEMGGCNANFRTSGTQHLPSLSPAFTAALLALGVLLLIVGLALFLAFFYLGSRLQFVLFDLVLRSDTTVAPSWRRFGGVTWRWMGLKVLFYMAALACIIPMLLPLLIPFFHSLKHTPGSGPINIPAFLFSMIGFIAAIFFFVLVVSALYSLLRDFGIPSMALENAPIGTAVARIFRLMHAEPGQVLLYVLMLFLIRLGATIVLYLALGIAALIAFIPFGGAAVVFWAVLRHAGTAGHIVMVGAFVVLGLLFAAICVVAIFILFGFMFTFFQAYALYFLGGRYPLIGTMLEQGNPPLVYAAAPSAPSPPWNP